MKDGLIYRKAAVKELMNMAVAASSKQTRVFARCANAIELLPEAEEAAIIRHGFLSFTTKRGATQTASR